MWKDSIWFALRQWRNQLRRVDFWLVFLSQIIFYLPSLSPGVGWGSAVEEGMAFAGGSGIAFPDALLQQNVLVIFLGAFLLAVLLGTLFSMICCSTNMIGGRGIGVSICGFLIIWQQICRANGVDSGMLSPVGVLDSYYQYGSGNIIPAVGYYVFLITVLLILGQRILYRIDMTD